MTGQDALHMRCPHCTTDLPAAVTVCPACGRAVLPSSPDALPAGTLLDGRYEVQSVLGRGGFGITYLAIHQQLHQRVAIKEFFPATFAARHAESGEILPRAEAVELYRRVLNRVIREGQLLARIDHRGIVRVHNLFQERNTAYLVMEFIDGRTLAAELRARGALPEAEVRAIAEQLVDALATIHALGICHLDIKAENVMLEASGRAVLLDFGAARQLLAASSETSLRFGSPQSAPLEVINGEETGPESDIFELGMLLYELLTGTKAPSALQRARRDRWIPDTLTAPWRELCAAALRLDREARPHNIRAWWAEQESAPTDETPGTDLPPGIPLIVTANEHAMGDETAAEATLPLSRPAPDSAAVGQRAAGLLSRTVPRRAGNPLLRGALILALVAFTAFAGGVYLRRVLRAPATVARPATSVSLPIASSADPAQASSHLTTPSHTAAPPPAPAPLSPPTAHHAPPAHEQQQPAMQRRPSGQLPKPPGETSHVSPRKIAPGAAAESSSAPPEEKPGRQPAEQPARTRHDAPASKPLLMQQDTLIDRAAGTIRAHGLGQAPDTAHGDAAKEARAQRRVNGGRAQPAPRVHQARFTDNGDEQVTTQTDEEIPKYKILDEQQVDANTYEIII